MEKSIVWVWPVVKSAAKLGSGKRFDALVEDVKCSNRKKGRKKMQDPESVAAANGLRKCGAKRYAALSAAGR